jgi:hypothetical protein
MIDAATCAAWRAALYRVHDGAGWIASRVGQPCPALATLLDAAGATRASLVTACNPRGRRLDDAANQARLAALHAALAAAGYGCRVAEGAADDRSWVEPSLWVPGLHGAECAALMRAHDQLAWLEYDAEGTATLHESGLAADHDEDRA